MLDTFLEHEEEKQSNRDVFLQIDIENAEYVNNDEVYKASERCI